MKHYCDLEDTGSLMMETCLVCVDHQHEKRMHSILVSSLPCDKASGHAASALLGRWAAK